MWEEKIVNPNISPLFKVLTRTNYILELLITINEQKKNNPINNNNKERKKEKKMKIKIKINKIRKQLTVERKLREKKISGIKENEIK